MSRKEIMLYRYFLLNRKIQLWLKKDELNHFVLVTFKEILEKDSWLLGGLLVGVRLVFDNLVTSLVFTDDGWMEKDSTINYPFAESNSAELKKNTSFKLNRNEIKLDKTVLVSLSTVRSIISSGSVEIKP